MMKKFLPLLLCMFCLVAQAQTVVVPDNIYFADQHLIIKDNAREIIQKQVDALLRYPTFFQAKVDRADTYFPIISRIFAEEGLPDDFKYLALQESGLVSDAVSTSNAVGFWQFKKEAAADHGLVINSDVDERKHIVNSSRGAAKYFVKSNKLYYKNWYNTLLSYYLGFTGAKAYAKPEHVDNKVMEVNNKTNWYLLTFLAHKVAFENFVGKNPNPPVVIQEVPVTVGQSLSDIALATQTDYAEIQKYNKWLSGSVVPGNKPYSVLVPVTNPNQKQAVLAANKTNTPIAPVMNPGSVAVSDPVIKTVNGLKAVVARRGDSPESLARAGKLSAKRFHQFNDMGNREPVKEGETYYLERKKSKANVAHYTAQPGEQLWHVAQEFGVKVKSLLWYNRMRKNENLVAGRVLWLQRRRPNNVPVEFEQTKPNDPVAPQPVESSQPSVIAKTEPAPAPKSKQPANKSASNKKIEDKLADVFGVKPAQEKVAKVDTKEMETDENITEVNEVEIPEPVAVAPVLVNTPSIAEPETDSTIAQVNDQKVPVEVIQESDPEVETINDTTLASAEPETEMAPGTKPELASGAVYPTKKPVTASNPAKSTPVTTATQPENSSIFKDSTRISAPAIKENTVSVTITEHVVSKGETLYSISRLYGIPVAQLQAWNNLPGLALSIGQNLQLTPPAPAAKAAAIESTSPKPVVVTAASMPAVTPRAATANAVTTQHVVASGESMYQISRRYGVTIKEIMEWNNKADFTVSPGEKLTIKPKSSSRK